MTPQVIPEPSLNRVLNKMEMEMAEKAKELAEKLNQMSMRVDALTVPVTIGPVVPVYESKIFREPNLTVPLNTAVSSARSIATPQSEQPATTSRLNLPINLTKNETPRGAVQLSPKKIDLDDIQRSKALVGPSPEELDEWMKGLQRMKIHCELIDVSRLRVDLEEIILGTISPDRLKTYQDKELLYLCKSITWKARHLHERLAEAAAEVGVGIGRSKSLQKTYRVDFTEKDREYEYVWETIADKRADVFF